MKQEMVYHKEEVLVSDREAKTLDWSQQHENQEDH